MISMRDRRQDEITRYQKKEWTISKDLEQLVSPKDWALIKKVEAYAKENMKSVSHGFDHTQRVYNLAYNIGRWEGADFLVILTAALLHDLGRFIEEGIGADHAETSAFYAKDFLKTMDFPREKLKPVFNAIRQHRAHHGDPPESVEAKVLSDADNLDALGAIGIGRTFTYGGNIQRDVRETIRFIRDNMLNRAERMHTETARRMARRRIDYMISFLQRIEDEVNGIQ